MLMMMRCLVGGEKEKGERKDSPPRTSDIARHAPSTFLPPSPSYPFTDSIAFKEIGDPIRSRG